MDIRNTSGGLDSLLLQIIQSQKTIDEKSNVAAPIAARKDKIEREKDSINLSNQGAEQNASKNNTQNKNGGGFGQNQSRLTSETIENLENGFRRIQEFETKSGKKFTRIEEFVNTDDRATRTVIQQNDSGSTTVLENVLDRQEDGSFRLTERFTDESGETKTNINYDLNPNNVDILLGRPPSPERTNDNPFNATRGTQFDVTT